MASTSESLLPSSTKENTPPSKTLTIILTLAIIIFLSAFLFFELPNRNSISDLPINLCTHSPNTSSCQAIVSEALASTPNTNPKPIHVFHAILYKSLDQLKSAAAAATADVGGRTGEPGRTAAALADCVQLFDLSRDRIFISDAAVRAGAYVDARTWMSAALTNHATCLDGLVAAGSVEPAMLIHLQSLISLASASLAVLNAVPGGGDDYVVKPVTAKFPAWVSRRDKKLLETVSADAIQANAVVAKDGSGKFTTVQEAVDSAPDRSKDRYVIYVKKGVYKENVNLGKRKTNVMIVGDGMDATVITGSLNVIDGASTFNSSTLGWRT